MLRTCLIALCFALLAGCTSSDVPKENSVQPNWSNGLTAEIRGDEDGEIYFCKRCANNFHFILHAGIQDRAVFQSINSWGFWNRSFTLVDKRDPKSKYSISRRITMAWTANAPMTAKIKAGGILITDINFCDGMWTIKPKLTPGKDYQFSMQGHFDEKDFDPREPKELRGFSGPFWVGHLDTNVVDLYIDRNVVDIINKVED